MKKITFVMLLCIYNCNIYTMLSTLHQKNIHSHNVTNIYKSKRRIPRQAKRVIEQRRYLDRNTRRKDKYYYDEKHFNNY